MDEIVCSKHSGIEEKLDNICKSLEKSDKRFDVWDARIWGGIVSMIILLAGWLFTISWKFVDTTKAIPNHDTAIVQTK